MKKSIIIVASIALLSLANASFADNHFGIQANYVNPHLTRTVPKKTGEYGGQIEFMPSDLNWGWVEIYAQGGAEYLKTSSSGTQSMYTVGAGPMIRFNILPHSAIDPYFVAGAEPSYISKTHFGGRNLGIHFAFRDTLGLGVSFGKDHHYNLGVAFIHYSNASIAKHNSGVSMPLSFSLSYRF